jgi:xanthine/CO dehydrogenase XdhC/CoxF family maturation factor
VGEAGSRQVGLLGSRRREAQHLPELHGSGGSGELRKRLGRGEVGRWALPLDGVCG